MNSTDFSNIIRYKMQTLNIRNDFLQVKEEDYYTAVAKYDMTDRMVQESMESIRQWYKMQPHLPEEALTDDRLFRHMLVVGFSMEKLKKKIDNMITARSIIPELMMDRDPCAPEIQELRQYASCAILPQRLDDMTRVFALAANPTSENPTAASMQSAMKLFFILYDYRLTADISVGEHYIIDFKNAKLSYVTGITPTLVKQSVFIHKHCFGSKVKGFHYVNVPSFAAYVIILIKAAMSKKMADRIHLHKDYESLHRIISKSILPSDFGGPNKSLQEYSDELTDEICKPEWCKWFAKQDQLKSDESKRIGEVKDMSTELLGIHGSFRKLEMD